MSAIGNTPGGNRAERRSSVADFAFMALFKIGHYAGFPFLSVSKHVLVCNLSY